MSKVDDFLRGLARDYNPQYTLETLFRYEGWTIQAFSDDTGVKEVFWGEHETCHTLIQGHKDHRYCPKCNVRVSPEIETILADALHMLRSGLVGESEAVSFTTKDGVIVGISPQTFPILSGK